MIGLFDTETLRMICLSFVIALFLALSFASTEVNASDNGPLSDESNNTAENGRYKAPKDTLWVQVASSQDLAEARRVAQQIGPSARIFSTANGWFAVTATIMDAEVIDRYGLEKLVRDNGWPKDAFLAGGSKYVTEMGVVNNITPKPAFIATQTLGKTPILKKSWQSNGPVYELARTAELGDTLIIWGQPDAQGDCVINRSRSEVVKCSNLDAFAATIASSQSSTANENNGGSTLGNAAETSVNPNVLKAEIDEQWNDHMRKMFTGDFLVKNVGDLIKHNRTGAISLMSKGFDLQLDTENLSFNEGTVLVLAEHDPTDVYKPVREAELIGKKASEIMMIKSGWAGRDFSGPSVTVICQLSSDDLTSLDGKKTANFRAKLINLDSLEATFDCKPL
ncbi:hypothetical protein [Ruegeria arenilitoris]|uniref:hypothetical protein n=1 Tax=Ruegeria arenilitoris TaxID=1173585 RepID=UPI00147A70B5|nr:hypothetical protein [Ruegeria arenilitoris]